MIEDFVASGYAHSLAFCREMVEHADIVVVIVGHRYGWVPDGADNMRLLNVADYEFAPGLDEIGRMTGA